METLLFRDSLVFFAAVIMALLAYDEKRPRTLKR